MLYVYPLCGSHARRGFPGRAGRFSRCGLTQGPGCSHTPGRRLTRRIAPVVQPRTASAQEILPVSAAVRPGEGRVLVQAGGEGAHSPDSGHRRNTRKPRRHDKDARDAAPGVRRLRGRTPGCGDPVQAQAQMVADGVRGPSRRMRANRHSPSPCPLPRGEGIDHCWTSQQCHTWGACRVPRDKASVAILARGSGVRFSPGILAGRRGAD